MKFLSRVSNKLFPTILTIILWFFGITDLKAQNIYTVAGGSSGDNKLASQVGLSVWSIAIDPSGNIFVVDSFNGRLRKIDASSGLINGVTDLSRDLSNAIIAIDGLGNLYLADSEGHTIKRLNVSTVI